MAFTEVVFFAIIIALLLINFAFGKSSCEINKTDSSDYYSKHFLRYENYVYASNIKTVSFCKPEKELTQPIIRLNSTDILQFSFDDLEAGEKVYNYKIVHCDFDWQPSDLAESQYEKGFNDNKISDSRFSYNTYQRYTHYQFNFPNENIVPLISGNFLMIVFMDDDENKIVITKRFMVVDPRVTISTDVHRATKINERNSRQEVDFSIFYPDYKIDDPFTDLKVAVYQNDRTDNVITNLKPLFLKNNELDYDYESENVFDGGNEFRLLDLRSLHSPAEGIKKIFLDSAIYNVYLKEDHKRSSYRYSAEHDINGGFVIRTDDAKSDALEAEYCFVHFLLPIESPYTNGNIYVFASFSDWTFNGKTKMFYNEEERAYEATIFLKQGYYDYEYVFVEDGFTSANETEIEGNHSETENTYMICVYNKPVNSRYDELIGLKRFNSFNY